MIFINIVFWAIVLLAAVILWFSINSLFPKIGSFICGLFEETKNNINEEKEEEE